MTLVFNALHATFAVMSCVWMAMRWYNMEFNCLFCLIPSVPYAVAFCWNLKMPDSPCLSFMHLLNIAS